MLHVWRCLDDILQDSLAIKLYLVSKLLGMSDIADGTFISGTGHQDHLRQMFCDL